MESEKDPRETLGDILECCDRIISNTNSLSVEEFEKDVNMQDAVIRRFEIIGEAVKHLSTDIRDQYPEVPWKLAAGFRDVLIHDYPEIVLDEVYRTGREHLPEFRKQIQKVLEDLEKNL